MSKYLDHNDIINEMGEPDYKSANKRNRLLYYIDSMVIFKRTKESRPQYTIKPMKFNGESFAYKHPNHENFIRVHPDVNKVLVDRRIDKILMGDE